MEEFIKITVHVMRSNPNASAEDILRLLIENGIDRLMAAQLVTLVPLAYGRVGLEGCGVSFSDHYICLEGADIGREHSLAALPLWNEAVAFAKREVSSGADGSALLAVAGRSSEIDAINKALRNGRKLQDFVCGPPVFLLPEFAMSIGARFHSK